MRLVVVRVRRRRAGADGARARSRRPKRVLAQAGLSLDDVGLFELNEPFAVQVLTLVRRAWASTPEDERLNPYGGAIACGHPLAATGVRLDGAARVRHARAARRALRPDGALRRHGHGRRAALGERCACLTRVQARPVETQARTRSRSSRSTTARTGRSRPSSAARRSSRSSGCSAELEGGDWVARCSPASRSSSAPAPTSTSSRTSRAETRERGQPRRPRALRAHPGAAVPDGRRDQRRLPRRRRRARAALRRARRSRAAVRHFAFPEVFLGLFPAWGGTQLVPRLVGPEAAIKLIVANPLRQNRMLTGRRRVELGLADRLLEPVEFLDESIAFALELVEHRSSGQPDWSDAGDDAAPSAHATVDDTVHGAAPAPYVALDLIEGAAEWTVEEGYAREEEAIARAAARPPGPGLALRVRPRRAAREAARPAARRRAAPGRGRSASSARG